MEKINDITHKKIKKTCCPGKHLDKKTIVAFAMCIDQRYNLMAKPFYRLKICYFSL